MTAAKNANANTRRNQTSRADVCGRQSKLSLDSFEDDVIVDRNAAMHGNIQHGQVHVLNHHQWGEFSSQGNDFSAQSTDMFQNN